MPEQTINHQLPHEEDSLHIIDMIGKPPGWIVRSGIGIISLFTLVILLLSWLIKYPDRLSSSAVLTTQNPVIEIMPKTTGLLDTIIIHDNEVVSRNTILATIEDAANVEDVFKLKAFVEQFQPTDMAILPKPSEGLQLGSLSDAYAKLNQQIDAYQYFLDQNDVQQQIRALEEEIRQTRILNTTTQKQQRLLQNESNIIAADLKRNQQLQEEGVISTVALEDKEKAMIQYQRQLEGLSANIIQNNIRTEQLKQQRYQLEQNWKDEKMSHITGLQQLLESIKGAISNWEASFVISAPINGMLVYAPKLANKQMVSPSNAIMTIVPVQEKGATMIRCNAPGNGIGKIKVGTPINLALDAYPQKEFGALNTVVKKISVVPSTDQSGQTTYEITAALPDTLITTYQKEIPLRQNMTGVATFITKDRSILERIFDSLLDFTKNN